MTRIWIATAMVATACGNTPDPGCRCEGTVSGGGRLSIDCGATQCIGGTGYRCVANGMSELEPLACPPPGTDAGMMLVDGGPPSVSCGIRAGTWSLTGRVLPSSTRADCTTMPAEAMFSTLDQAAGVGTCLTGCTCSDSPAVAPGCTASWAVACSDGSSIAVGYSKTTETAIDGFNRLEFGDGTVCDFEVTGVWVR